MAVSVNWATGVISVPKADTTLVEAGPPEIRSYDVYEKLWKELKALEDDEQGIVWDDAQAHVTTKTLSGITFAHIVEIVNSYTVEFEDGQYTVRLGGCNHNVLDVAVANQVRLVGNLSAGLIVAGSGVTAQDKTDIAQEVLTAAQSAPIHSDTRKITGTNVTGSGTEADPWGP